MSEEVERLLAEIEGRTISSREVLIRKYYREVLDRLNANNAEIVRSIEAGLRRERIRGFVDGLLVACLLGAVFSVFAILVLRAGKP